MPGHEIVGSCYVFGQNITTLPEAYVTHKPEKKLNCFYSKKKEPVPDFEQSDIAYNIPCNDCDAV